MVVEVRSVLTVGAFLGTLPTFVEQFRSISLEKLEAFIQLARMASSVGDEVPKALRAFAECPGFLASLATLLQKGTPIPVRVRFEILWTICNIASGPSVYVDLVQVALIRRLRRPASYR